MHRTGSSSARYLLVNNNNSRTKFALSSAQRISDYRAVPTEGLDGSVLAEVLDGWRYDRVVIASVVPESAVYLKRALRDKPQLDIDYRSPLGVEVDFPNPSSIGADRLANAAAVVALYDAAPAIVVDFGTALTFDIISAQRAYIGGVIAPGLDAMTDYLHRRTALLPKLDLREPPAAIGRSTIDAMLSGAVHGYRGLVRGILAEVGAELAEGNAGGDAGGAKGEVIAPKIVATGGYAELIAAGLPELSEVNKMLTLEGLRIIANHHFQEQEP